MSFFSFWEWFYLRKKLDWSWWQECWPWPSRSCGSNRLALTWLWPGQQSAIFSAKPRIKETVNYRIDTWVEPCKYTEISMKSYIWDFQWDRYVPTTYLQLICILGSRQCGSGNKLTTTDGMNKRVKTVHINTEISNNLQLISGAKLLNNQHEVNHMGPWWDAIKQSQPW